MPISLCEAFSPSHSAFYNYYHFLILKFHQHQEAPSPFNFRFNFQHLISLSSAFISSSFYPSRAPSLAPSPVTLVHPPLSGCNVFSGRLCCLLPAMIFKEVLAEFPREQLKCQYTQPDFSQPHRKGRGSFLFPTTPSQPRPSPSAASLRSWILEKPWGRESCMTKCFRSKWQGLKPSHSDFLSENPHYVTTRGQFLCLAGCLGWSRVLELGG